MSDTVTQIVSFLRGKGLPDSVIAAALGNMRVESSIDPTKPNPGEGAIGLCQWEGGRRTALDAFARARGTSETDLQTQLEFMWHEWHTTESYAFQQIMQHAGSAGSAAAAWDQYYERSDGTMRQTRVSDAQQYAANGLKGIGGEGASVSGDGTQLAGAAPGRKQYIAAMGAAGDLINSVPELRQLLQQALSGNWTTARLANAVENSDWYKNHSDSARSILAQAASDPASYQEQLQHTVDTLSILAHQNGWDLAPDQLRNIARNALLTGNDGNTQWLTIQAGRKQDYSDLKNVDSLQGGMAATVSQLQQVAADYGFTYHDPSRLAGQAKQILMGNQTIDTYTEQMKAYAKSAFPGLSDLIDQGQTVKDIASPYIQSMSTLLEMDPNSLSTTTPMIRRALQGTQGVSAGKGSTPTLQPLWQFEDQVRKDPRWAMTDNAHQEAASTLIQLGQAWGFAE